MQADYSCGAGVSTISQHVMFSHDAERNRKYPFFQMTINVSGAGTIFQQGGQDQPFPAGGLGGAVSAHRGPGQSPGGKRILTTIV